MDVSQQLQMILPPDQSVLLVDQREPFLNEPLLLYLVTACRTESHYHDSSVTYSLSVYVGSWCYGVKRVRIWFQ